jgi:hypothetical protein
LRTVFGTLRLRTVKVVDAFVSLLNGEALPAAKR